MSKTLSRRAMEIVYLSLTVLESWFASSFFFSSFYTEYERLTRLGTHSSIPLLERMAYRL